MVEVSFGEWLSHRRKALGLTQHDLACRVNCAVITIRKIEAEQRRPSLLVAERLAQILAIPVAEQKTFLRYARGEWYSIPSIEIRPLPWRPVSPSRSVQLPPPHLPFVGREKELAELLRLMIKFADRLVTIVGAPGVGKSRLAAELTQAVGSEFPGSIYFINLDRIDEPNHIAPLLLQTLGAGASGDHTDLPHLIAEVSNKHILLLLDNAENLVKPLRPLLYSLLQECPNLKILLTSREPLHLLGEALLLLTPLDLPGDHEKYSFNMETAANFSALKMFATCARLFQPGFSITTENLYDIVSICEHLGGLPLAIELFASRLQLMTPRSLLAHLSSQFVLQSTAPGYLPENHKSLQCTLDRSYTALSPEEKRLFTYLSVFEGSFSLEMVESAFAATPAHNAIADLLSCLLDKSLVQQAAGMHAEPHFYLFKVIRLYAAEHLKDFDQDAMAAWHYPPDMLRLPPRARVDTQLQKKLR